MFNSALRAAALGLPIAFCAYADASIETSHLGSDAELNALIDQIAAVAEGRIGNNGVGGTYEVGLGPDIGNPFTTGNTTWTNGQTMEFVLLYDGSLLTFQLGGATVAFPTTDPMTDIFIRAQADPSNSSVLVDNLELDLFPIADQSSAVGDNGLDILRISGGDIDDGFFLTGDSVLAWTGSLPVGSELSFQIILATVVPAPASALVLLTGLVGCGRRRRR